MPNVVDLRTQNSMNIPFNELFLISKGILDDDHMVSPEKMEMIGIDPEPFDGDIPASEVGVFYQSREDNNFYEVEMVGA